MFLDVSIIKQLKITYDDFKRFDWFRIKCIIFYSGRIKTTDTGFRLTLLNVVNVNS